MKTYFVGRSKKADIILSNADSSVSSLHLELVELVGGKYYVVDRKSSNGTFQQQNRQWMAIQQTYVSIDEPLLLGKYQTSVRELLALRATVQAETSYNGLVQRNPETGEIIPRSK